MLSSKFLLLFTIIYSSVFSYELSICSIFQDEAPYLKEWIEYHKLVGVEHFYLYNDRSSDHYLEVLSPYIEEGIVDLFNCPPINNERHFYNQKRAYIRGLNQSKNVSKWLALIDLDEFIVPKENLTIPLMLKSYEDCFNVTIHWQKFGTSGYFELPSKSLLIECLIKKSPPHDEDNFITKSIVQPLLLPDYFFSEEYIIEHEIDVVHFYSWPLSSEAKKKPLGPLTLEGKIQKAIPIEDAQINHYWCRDEKFYREKKVPRKARLQHEDFNSPLEWPEEKIEKYLTRYNQCDDFTVLRFVPELKKKLSLE